MSPVVEGMVFRRSAVGREHEKVLVKAVGRDKSRGRNNELVVIYCGHDETSSRRILVKRAVEFINIYEVEVENVRTKED